MYKRQALTRLADACDDDIAHHAWLRADPALIQPDLNGARLMGVGSMLPLTTGDAQALLPALRPLFGDAGFAFDAPHPQRWYLRLPAGTPLPAFAPPEAALGEDPFDHQPQGDAAAVRRWRVLANEAQVVLHNHPHNARRRAAGLPAINALWFHGAGRLPQAATGRFPTVVSNDPLLHGLARLANIPARPLPEDGLPMVADALIDLRGVRGDALLDGLLRAQAVGGARHWALDGGPGIAFQPRQRWRLWRRPVDRLAA